MSKAKSQRKRRRRGGATGRKKGGLMLGMRSGFKNIASSVTGQETTGKSRWIGNVITVLLILAAIGLILSRWS